MLALNKTVLAGNVAKTTIGEKIARIRIGVNERYKDDSGQWQNKATFIDVITFAPAKIKLIKEHVIVGQHLYIEGKINTSSYEKDNQTVYTTDIIMTELQFVSAKSQD